MLQLRRSDFAGADPETLATLHRSFQRDRAVRLPQWFDADLVHLAQRHIREASFFEHDDGIALEACMHDNVLVAMLDLIMNDDRVFEAIRAVTDCPPLRMFAGRVYRMHAPAGHADQWHSDADGKRLVGISVNLSEGAFTGGVFQLRRRHDSEPHWSFANTRPGDAVLFAIDEDLQHRVTPVDGSIPRVAYAGWFQAQPTFLSMLKSAAHACQDGQCVEVY